MCPGSVFCATGFIFLILIYGYNSKWLGLSLILCLFGRIIVLVLLGSSFRVCDFSGHKFLDWSRYQMLISSCGPGLKLNKKVHGIRKWIRMINIPFLGNMHSTFQNNESYPIGIKFLCSTSFIFPCPMTQVWNVFSNMVLL